MENKIQIDDRGKGELVIFETNIGDINMKVVKSGSIIKNDKFDIFRPIDFHLELTNSKNNEMVNISTNLHNLTLMSKVIDGLSDVVYRNKIYSGYVSWFNKDKYFGFIQPNDNMDPVFVHISSVLNTDTLFDNQDVLFTIDKNHDSVYADSVYRV